MHARSSLLAGPTLATASGASSADQQASADVELQRLRKRVRSLEQIVHLRRRHRNIHEKVERVPLPSPEEFFQRFWVPGTPAIFTDLVTRWPAFRKWSVEFLVKRFGDLHVEVCSGRTGEHNPDRTWRKLRRRVTLAHFLDLALNNSRPNDLYLIKKNNAFSVPGLGFELLNDVGLPSSIFRTPSPPSAGLWIGGAGTHVPLHHDAGNNMFCQVVGSKRIQMLPPECVDLLESANDVYSEFSTPTLLCEARTVVLAAGEALFIPAGWWHQVDGLEFSISVSLTCFVWNNNYNWYLPGARRVP